MEAKAEVSSKFEVFPKLDLTYNLDFLLRFKPTSANPGFMSFLCETNTRPESLLVFIDLSISITQGVSHLFLTWHRNCWLLNINKLLFDFLSRRVDGVFYCQKKMVLLIELGLDSPCKGAQTK